MKKVLALFLAVLMLCGCFGVSASAADEETLGLWGDYFGPGKIADPAEECIIVYYPGVGAFPEGTTHYSYKQGPIPVGSNYKGVLVDAPFAGNSPLKAHEAYHLKSLAPAEGYEFRGWRFYGYVSGNTVQYETNNNMYLRLVDGGTTIYPGDSWILLPTNCEGEILKFEAEWRLVAEEDTMAMILGIMVKIFGAIIGIVMYQGDTEAGVALMEKVLGGIL